LQAHVAIAATAGNPARLIMHLQTAGDTAYWIVRFRLRALRFGVT
jgi:hypothetical protein